MIIQKNHQYNSHVPQTSFKSTMLPVVFIQTTQTNQSQTLAQLSSKVKIRNVLNSTFVYTNTNSPLTSGRTVFYQPESDYQFTDPRDGAFNYLLR